jgi:hypothetical protein
MKAMRSLIGAALIVCTSLTLLPVSGNAQGGYYQHREDHRYIGSYLRNLPNGRGTELLAISPGGNATLTHSGPRGRSETFTGTWFIRHGKLHLTISGPHGNRTMDYNLSGSNLNLVGDAHIFYKKQ